MTWVIYALIEAEERGITQGILTLWSSKLKPTPPKRLCGASWVWMQAWVANLDSPMTSSCR